MPTKTILIIGAGFAGIRCALDLEKAKNRGRISEETRIILVSNKCHMEYYPALYRTVAGGSPVESCIPLREIFEHTSVQVVQDSIVNIDIKKKSATGTGGSTYAADYLVVAVGSQNTFFNIEGLGSQSFNFKSVHNALRLRRQIQDMFKSHVHASPEELVVALHFVIIGGGASGTELAGELALYTKEQARLHNIDESFITIDLIEGSDDVLSAMDEQVSDKAAARLRELGVNVLCNRRVTKTGSWTVMLGDMKLGTKTVIWAAGVKVNELVSKTEGFKFGERGRVSVDEFMQAHGYDHVYVAGDNADTKYSGLAQTAIYDGRYIARHIIANMHGWRMRPYKEKPVSYNIPIGHGWSVFVHKGVTLFGRFAWILREVIDLVYFMSILPMRKAWRVWRSNVALSEECEDCVVYENDSE